MRSSQVASEAGVNVQTLRYYERRGLLHEPERLPSGYRSYDPEAVRTVRFVKRAQQLGFSLQEVETLLDLAGGGPDSCDTARALATEKLDQLGDKITSLEAMQDSLRQLVATCDRSPHERLCPLLEAIDHDDLPEPARTLPRVHGDLSGGTSPKAVLAGGHQPDFDLVVVGSGSAAFAAAIRARNLGATVAMVEADTVGGTCVNVGCIPSKALLAAADTYWSAGHHHFPGIATSQAGVDMAAIVAGKDEIVATLRDEKYLGLAAEYGFEIFRGHGSFTDPTHLSVGGKELTARDFLLATGAAPSAPPVTGLEEAGYLTSTTAMGLGRVPESLVVVGGSYVGLELGQLFANLGTKVTVVEALGRLMPEEEPEVSAWITGVLRDQGVDVVTSAAVVAATPGGRKTVVVDRDGHSQRIEAEEILVATGRRPRLEGLGLGAAGIELDARGRLVLDDELRTTNPAVYAAGDVTGAPQFVYVAAAQGTLAADNAVGGAHRCVDDTALPRVTFTTPGIAAVGLTDAQARAAGIDCECRVLELAHVPRARVARDTRGGIKLVAERASGRVLGLSAVADGAGDLALAGVYAVKFGLTVADLAGTWAPYLTMAEAVKLVAQTFSTDITKLSCCAA